MPLWTLAYHMCKVYYKNIIPSRRMRLNAKVALCSAHRCSVMLKLLMNLMDQASEIQQAEYDYDIRYPIYG